MILLWHITHHIDIKAAHTKHRAQHRVGFGRTLYMFVMTNLHVSLDKTMNYIIREVREKVTLNGLWPTNTDIKNKFLSMLKNLKNKVLKLFL